MNRRFFRRLAAVLALAVPQMVSAQTARPQGSASFTPPQIIPLGSSLTYTMTNAPDTFTATTTFSSTPVTVDNGAVKIWQTQTATAANAEWDVFYMETTSGGPLAGAIDGNWQIVINYDLSAAADFDQVVNQWLVNGTPVSPLTNGIGSICCATTTNPIIPGAAYYNSGFSGALAAGVQTNWRQIYVDPYSLVSNGGIDASTANEFIFGLHFTLQPPGPVVQDAVSASAFGEFPTFAPGSWIEIYGTDLAAGTQTWGASDFSGVIGPTTLGGTTVTIGGQSAFIDYVSPLQVNVQVPGGVTTGAQPLVVTTAAGSSAPFTVTVNTTQPGLLNPANFDIGGTKYVVAQFADGSYVLPPNAIAGLTSERAKPGDTIVFYGIGFGSVSPNIPPGQLVELSNTLSDKLTVSFGGAPATISYDGLAPTYMGLYQFNIIVPSVAPSDTVPLTFTLNGVSGTQALSIAIGN